jgi:hypothetical protein
MFATSQGQSELANIFLQALRQDLGLIGVESRLEAEFYGLYTINVLRSILRDPTESDKEKIESALGFIARFERGSKKTISALRPRLEAMDDAENPSGQAGPETKAVLDSPKDRGNPPGKRRRKETK